MKVLGLYLQVKDENDLLMTQVLVRKHQGYIYDIIRKHNGLPYSCKASFYDMADTFSFMQEVQQIDWDIEVDAIVA